MSNRNVPSSKDFPTQLCFFVAFLADFFPSNRPGQLEAAKVIVESVPSRDPHGCRSGASKGFMEVQAISLRMMVS